MNDKIKIVDNPKLSDVTGFVGNAIACQIKKKDKLDLGIVYSKKMCDVFAMYTKNRYKAAPIVVCKEHLKNNKAQAIVVNSGNANACTGEEGILDARLMCEESAKILGIKTNDVLVSSTGVIGQRLPMDKIKNGINELKNRLSEPNENNFALSIMTTDTKIKICGVMVTIHDKSYTIYGCAKGSGMIHPNMATMLTYIFTDANLKKSLLKRAFFSTIERSFNSITVDGDTSTNDTAIVLANGEAKNKLIDNIDSEEYKIFCEALTFVTKTLAKKIVEDGEGATKLIEINIQNAKSDKDAKKIGMAIAKSNLVKTAFFGEYANWGRIICALGYSEADFNPESAKLSFGNIVVFDNGKNINFNEDEAKDILSKREIKIYLDLKNGNSNWTVWTCDLSYDYVKINGSYRS